MNEEKKRKKRGRKGDQRRGSEGKLSAPAIVLKSTGTAIPVRLNMHVQVPIHFLGLRSGLTLAGSKIS
jgi:hypothetical protein